MVSQPNNSGLANNRTKLIILIIYIAVVLGTPFLGHVPLVREYLNRNAKSYISNDADIFFKDYIQVLKTGTHEQIYALMPPQAPQYISTSTLQEFTSHLASTTSEVTGISLNVNKVVGQGTYYYATYELKNNDPVYKYVIAELVAVNNGNGLQIFSTHLAGEARSITDYGPYDFFKQTPLWILAFMVPMFIAYTGLQYIRKAQSPNWVMFLTILLGSLYIIIFYRNGNVTSGLNVGIFTAMYKNSFGYYYMIPIPIGAMYYWIRRRQYEVVDDNKSSLYHL